MKTRFAIPVVLLIACTRPEPPPPPPETDRLVFKMLAQELTFDGCTAGAVGCTYVRLDYPVLVDAPEGYAVDAVTDLVFSAIQAAYTDAEPYETADALMQTFIGQYRELKRAQPDYEHPWFLERKVFVLHNTEDVLSLSISERTYTGGAHGMATIVFRNVDPRTGEPLGLSDVLEPEYEAKLLPIAEAKFREARQIEDGTSLTDAGFTFFDDGAFALTDNFAIGENELTFYYNVYEVAPYALGTTEIVIGYDELEGLLKD